MRGYQGTRRGADYVAAIAEGMKPKMPSKPGTENHLRGVFRVRLGISGSPLRSQTVGPRTPCTTVSIMRQRIRLRHSP